MDRVKAIADRHTASTGSDPAAGAPVSWLTITDPAAARVALAELADWLTRVYLYYPGSLDSLGECWPWHPAAVEELLALRGSWLAAYASPDATPARALDWHDRHDRHLPGVHRRLRATLGDCSLTAHRRGGRADQLRPALPATDALDPLAKWWDVSHGTTGAPPPTPDLHAQQEGTRHG